MVVVVWERRRGAMCERWLARWRGDRCVLFASGLGLAVLCGCCVVGVLVGALCASGGWHIAGGVGWMALWVAFWAVMCEWLLAHWADCLVPLSPRADKPLLALASVAAVCLCL